MTHADSPQATILQCQYCDGREGYITGVRNKGYDPGKHAFPVTVTLVRVQISLSNQTQTYLIPRLCLQLPVLCQDFKLHQTTNLFTRVDTVEGRSQIEATTASRGTHLMGC